MTWALRPPNSVMPLAANFSKLRCEVTKFTAMRASVASDWALHTSLIDHLILSVLGDKERTAFVHHGLEDVYLPKETA